jgi:hypothetical protein
MDLLVQPYLDRIASLMDEGHAWVVALRIVMAEIEAAGPDFGLEQDVREAAKKQWRRESQGFLQSTAFERAWRRRKATR